MLTLNDINMKFIHLAGVNTENQQVNIDKIIFFFTFCKSIFTFHFNFSFPHTVVNAYYNIIENSIEFPAGILQGAFFSSDRPK